MSTRKREYEEKDRKAVMKGLHCFFPDLQDYTGILSKQEISNIKKEVKNASQRQSSKDAVR